MAAVLIAWTSCVYGDGIFIPVNPQARFTILDHHVSVSIDGQAATTHIEQSFQNTTDLDNQEATYMFPLPSEAIVSSFAMTVGGEWAEAKLLDADSASAIYWNYVRQRIDPALLEYAGRGAYRARIFPIGPHK
jgi:Ca-activated chloride channel family protein